MTCKHYSVGFGGFKANHMNFVICCKNVLNSDLNQGIYIKANYYEEQVYI